MTEETAITKREPIVSMTKDEFTTSIGLTVQDIKNHYAPNATDAEFAIFLDQAASCNLDPRKKEIYFVKYGQQKGNVITAYHTYIQRAERTGLLDGWDAELVRNDKGDFVGAKVTIHRKDWKHPFVWDVARSEFDKKQSTWNAMPGFMLKKVCIAQAFRLAFPDEVGGLPYTSDEVSTFADEETSKMVVAAARKPQTVEAEVIEEAAPPPPPPAPVQKSEPEVDDDQPPPPPPAPVAEEPKAPVENSQPATPPLEDDVIRKIASAFAQLSVSLDELEAIAGDSQVWTEAHRVWLLAQYKAIRTSKLTQDAFKKMTFDPNNAF